MFKLSLIIISLSSLTTLVALWQIQLPEVQTNVAAEDNWKLPNLPQADGVQIAYNKLHQLYPWKADEIKPAPPPAPSAQEEAKKVEESPRPPPTDWQLVGIIQQGQRRYVLILDKTNKVSQFAIKSVLPNGASLLSIHDDFIEVSNKSKVETVRLYR
jgi:hypothetical protein